MKKKSENQIVARIIIVIFLVAVFFLLVHLTLADVRDYYGWSRSAPLYFVYLCYLVVGCTVFTVVLLSIFFCVTIKKKNDILKEQKEILREQKNIIRKLEDMENIMNAGKDSIR